MENQNSNEKANDTVLALEAVLDLENHIFIRSPYKTPSDSPSCFKCGKPSEHHRWKSPHPWPQI